MGVGYSEEGYCILCFAEIWISPVKWRSTFWNFNPSRICCVILPVTVLEYVMIVFLSSKSNSMTSVKNCHQDLDCPSTLSAKASPILSGFVDFDIG